MKVLYNDIKNFIEGFNLRPTELKDLFEEIGIEVENFVDLSDGLKDRILPAIVKEVNVDGNLKILKIYTKLGEFQVITTANVSINDKVVFALEGAKLRNGEVISRRNIKGYLSEGILLSEKELEISEIGDSLIKLPLNFSLNDDVLNYLQLNDYLYELYIFPNRGDLMGLLGICYEIASYLKLNVKLPEMLDDESLESFNFPIEIRDNEGCFRYIGRVIRDVEVKQSPDFLRYKLHILGFRSINNVVDITNYVMWEIGEPLHAFDLDKLHELIVVRTANKDEKILCLDGYERILDSDILVIADKNKVLAIAGIIGGEDSSINPSTKNILLESALFNKVRISKASRKLKVKTESSKRFEKGLNWSFVEIASRRAGYLISKYCGGVVYKGVDVYEKKIERKKMKISLTSINEILGTALSEDELNEILTSIGIRKVDSLYEIPYHREDIENENDIAEEVSKHIGLSNIPSYNEFKIFQTPKIGRSAYQTAVNFLFPRGYYEAKTLSLISEQKAKSFSESYLRILNPISDQISVYRNYIISSLLDSLSLNVRRNGYGTKLVEFGNVFRDGEEFESIGMVVGGKKIKRYFENDEHYGIYELKGDIEALFEYLNYNYTFKISKRAFLRTCIDIYLEGELVGFLGELKRSILKLYDIRFPVYACELRLLEPKVSSYREISKFPKVEKDISVLIRKDEHYLDLENVIKSLNIPYLSDFYLIDVYEGASIGDEYRSLTFRLVFLSNERTLRDEEVNSILMNVIKEIEVKGYRVRRA